MMMMKKKVCSNREFIVSVSSTREGGGRGQTLFF